MQFTAIITGHKRDIHTSNPKALLAEVRFADRSLFRDHTYIPLHLVDRLLPKAHSKKKILIAFEATLTPYTGRNGESIGLSDIVDIRPLKRNITMDEYRSML